MIYSEMSTGELVSMTLMGNGNAYEALVNRYQYAAIGAAYSVTHDSYFAEDAAQDAFVSAWVHLDTLRESEKFGAWICRIAKNRAKNILERTHNSLPYDEEKNRIWDACEDPDAYLFFPPEYENLHTGIQKLSQKVRQVIVMHYFQGLSLAEIADRLCIPVGTVKYRLFDGREKLRKELGKDMKEEISETFVQRVMKKVEQVKLWKLKNNKDGFEEFYREVLSDLDLLPETEEQQYALADVLLRGCWWIKGEKNDEVLERIRIAAENGKNEEAIQMLLHQEFSAFSGTARIELIRDKQIPRMQNCGYQKAEGYLWFWLGRECFRIGKEQDGFAAYQMVLKLLDEGDIFYVCAVSAIASEKKQLTCKRLEMISVFPGAQTLRIINGRIRHWENVGYHSGTLLALSGIQNSIFYYPARCDALYFDSEMRVGETYVGSNRKTSLTYLDDDAVAETACGIFWGCRVWENKMYGSTVRTYYKPNIGIVRMEFSLGSKQDVSVLKSYNVVGGTGLIPLAKGNRWEYEVVSLNKKAFADQNVYEVVSFDGETAMLSHFGYVERVAIDTDDWLDNMRYARNHYSTRSGELIDVSEQLARAKELAKTPLQKEHTRIATEVMERIFGTSQKTNPDTRVVGIWNFFRYETVEQEGGIIRTVDSREFSFEWKGSGIKPATTAYSLLYNHVYSIFMDAMDGCLWNDAWKIGDSGTLKFKFFDADIETEYHIEGGGTVITAAGAFNGCLRFCIDMKNVPWNGWHYRGGYMEYYFAPEVGLVRSIHYFHSRKMSATFDLTSFVGTGKGYFPLSDGFVRRYDAVDLGDGYEASAEYICQRAEDGSLVLLKNKTGIRHLNSENEKSSEKARN